MDAEALEGHAHEVVDLLVLYLLCALGPEQRLPLRGGARVPGDAAVVEEVLGLCLLVELFGGHFGVFASAAVGADGARGAGDDVFLLCHLEAPEELCLGVHRSLFCLVCARVGDEVEAILGLALRVGHKPSEADHAVDLGSVLPDRHQLHILRAAPGSIFAQRCRECGAPRVVLPEHRLAIHECGVDRRFDHRALGCGPYAARTF
mmetsp:Transcript_25921/g.61478  ORF Transcript_25921/g.61478 Transcript_25921/m.61478 type:complete len:205 (+) Transcript_25921:522-1136(+)